LNESDGTGAGRASATKENKAKQAKANEMKLYISATAIVFSKKESEWYGLIYVVQVAIGKPIDKIVSWETWYSRKRPLSLAIVNAESYKLE
jgi:hypothetical protein